VVFCHPPGEPASGTLAPERQRDAESVTSKRTRTCQPEAGTQGCPPLSAQELGPAPQLCRPGRRKGYCSSPLETSPILVSLAA